MMIDLIAGIGFFIAGAIAVGALSYFWDDIKQWLNTVAADAVERAFGYNARQQMHKAVAVVDRVFQKLKNTSTVYSKRNDSDLYYDKTTIHCEIGVEEVTEEVLAEFDKRGQRLVQEFCYKH